MDTRGFAALFRRHRARLAEAWNALSDADLAAIDGDLAQFLLTVEATYHTPAPTLLRELDAVQKTIDAGTDADLAPHLDPAE